MRLAGPDFAGLMSGVVTGIIDVAWVARLGAGAAARTGFRVRRAGLNRFWSLKARPQTLLRRR
ncbi:MAG: hypothetical protein HOV78_02895 [Hamadaea sp.]|nr:hypothetical protein [Hamadaea sp.]NUT02438.1 hypothetical protein [Hamadaea sp.]